MASDVIASKSPEPEVRDASLKDATEIYLLGKRTREIAFSDRFPFHEKEELREFIHDHRQNIVLVAIRGKNDGKDGRNGKKGKKGKNRKNGDKLAGFLLAKILSRAHDGWCMLDNLVVDKGCRGQGIGSALLDALYAELNRRRITYVQLLVEQDCPEARSFWKKKGFKETKRFIWAERMIP